jgi:hypothetical protein
MKTGFVQFLAAFILRPGLAVRRVFGVAGVTALTGFAVTGCSSGDPDGSASPSVSCEPSVIRPCAHPGCEKAHQACLPEGTGWGTCYCEDVTGTGGASNTNTQKFEIGQKCEMDEDCSRGAFCLTESAESFFGGGPPSGVCVADCSADAAKCSAFAGAVCVAVGTSVGGQAPPDAGPGPTALCFEHCAVGTDEPKCRSLPGVACEPVAESATDGFCRPICVTDRDCGSRTCDPHFGVCVDARSFPDTSLGLPCRATGSDSCDGLCLSLDPAYAVCSHRCVFGDTSECASVSAPERTGGCLFASESGGVGDTGYCAELCDCPSDCRDKSDICDPLGTSLAGAFGRHGVCAAPALALGAPITCP